MIAEELSCLVLSGATEAAELSCLILSDGTEAAELSCFVLSDGDKELVNKSFSREPDISAVDALLDNGEEAPTTGDVRYDNDKELLAIGLTTVAVFFIHHQSDVSDGSSVYPGGQLPLLIASVLSLYITPSFTRHFIHLTPCLCLISRSKHAFKTWCPGLVIPFSHTGLS